MNFFSLEILSVGEVVTRIVSSSWSSRINEEAQARLPVVEASHRNWSTAPIMRFPNVVGKMIRFLVVSFR